MQTTLSTQAIPEGERLDFWRDLIGRMFMPLECAAGAGTSFSADLHHAPVGALDLMTMAASPHAVTRSARLARKSDADYFMVSYQISGHGYLKQEDKESKQKAGDFVVYDSTRPFDMEYDGNFSKYILRIPRRLLNAHISSPEKLCGLTIDSKASPSILLGGMLRSLAENNIELTSPVSDSIANALIELVVGGLQSLPQSRQCEVSRLHMFHISRVKNYVIQNLRDPSLNVEKVAMDLKMSVSSLYRIFGHEEQPLSQWIWSQRLQLCQKDLKSHALKGKNIGEIAFDWGFSNCTHFSRAFKRETGMTPKEFRQQHFSGREISAV
ncbi:AraC-type DNA-binding protein [Pseudomonas sp. NFIX10]|uniref:AraC-like ligand-binding domain-containing protein n=1 Tax=unclassified Pseudomonas TaxID=196821 RepID=UPI0008E7C8AA|nr:MULTISPECIES: helix-turn-helix domain-containing protein [unclassified Pseudomonas]SFB53676.1 AraC-type DNA-binding protein [Pseudomonas sp. NFIX10]SFF40560.1 AraC-type DNA-binding protein [Pseudomonas sp. NFACC06-1]